ncbi:hypothetical protein RF11_12504 [Thelohanellus kitauei]|uniref:Uncharacterized protein n=1 Tax=Thelohanellus kitauei TaxID=669202 RepID=A0A0C2NGR6_THEKT|nr:hypothetical protein RF11_12504 [Thelohanellus kitauei]
MIHPTPTPTVETWPTATQAAVPPHLFIEEILKGTSLADFVLSGELPDAVEECLRRERHLICVTFQDSFSSNPVPYFPAFEVLKIEKDRTELHPYRGRKIRKIIKKKFSHILTEEKALEAERQEKEALLKKIQEKEERIEKMKQVVDSLI